MRLPLLACLSACCLISNSFGGGTEPFKELQPQRVATIATMLPAEPAGFGKPIGDRNFWKHPETLSRAGNAVHRANPLLNKAFPPWSDELYLDFSKTGRRPPGEAMIRAREAWLEPLVIAECLENQGRFLPAIQLTLEAYLAQPTWTLPAHDYSLSNFHRSKYTVDLRAAETAADLSQALYLLDGKINADLRSRLMAALEQRIFSPIRASLNTHKGHWWLGEKSDPIKNNWNAVCLAGVVGAARTVLPDRNDRAVFIAAGEHYTQYFVNAFTDDGYCDEGAGYWSYGFGNFVGLREVLADATAGKIDLFDSPKIIRMALYGKRIGFPQGDVPPYADCRAGTKTNAQLIGYCDRVFGLASSRKEGSSGPGLRGLARMFTSEIPARVRASSPPTEESLRSFFDTVGVLICRSGNPSAGRLSASIKAGGNRSHSHNDVGSFVISLNGQQPVGDPGGPHAYDNETFGPKRYQKQLLNSFGHPVPVVDGKLQVDATTIKPKVLETHFQPTWDRITIDMTPAYQAPSLKKLTRTMTFSRLENGKVHLDDHVVFAKPSSFETALTTRWKATRTSESTLEFSKDGNTLQAEITTPDGFDLTETQIEELAAPSFTRIGIKLRKPITDAVVRIKFTAPSTDRSNSLPTLWIIGDSTVKVGTAGQRGWGEEIGAFFDSSKIRVVNRAIGGRSSRTFVSEGRWGQILKELKKGDFVIMQFGHNDASPINENPPVTASTRARGAIRNNSDESVNIINVLTGKPETVRSYGWYLRHISTTAKEKGATPLICSPIPRKSWNQDGKVNRTTDSWSLWARQAAEQTGAEFIDLNEIIARAYEQLGSEKVEPLFADKGTHTSEAGAIFNAKAVVSGFRSLQKDPLGSVFSEQGKGIPAFVP